MLEISHEKPINLLRVIWGSSFSGFLVRHWYEVTVGRNILFFTNMLFIMKPDIAITGKKIVFSFQM